MIYTEEMQYGLDIDWFLVDNEGRIAHIASGGGKIPSSVAISESDNEQLTIFFRSLPETSKDFIVNPKLNKYVVFNSLSERVKYLEDFSQFAKRGLYSFDKTVLGDSSNEEYHLVTIPSEPIKAKDLPIHIIHILEKTKINRHIDTLETVNIGEVK